MAYLPILEHIIKAKQTISFYTHPRRKHNYCIEPSFNRKQSVSVFLNIFRVQFNDCSASKQFETFFINFNCSHYDGYGGYCHDNE